MGPYTQLVKTAGDPAEAWLWRGAGALGGGALGWLVGRVVNKKKKRSWLTWLIAAAGAGVGGLGAEALLRYKPDNGSGSAMEKMDIEENRAFANMSLEELQNAVAANKKLRSGYGDAMATGASTGGLLGALLGIADSIKKYTPWSQQFFNGRAEAAKNYANAHGMQPLPAGVTLLPPPSGAPQPLKDLYRWDKANKIDWVTNANGQKEIRSISPTLGDSLKATAKTIGVDTGIGVGLGTAGGALGHYIGKKQFGNQRVDDATFARMQEEVARRLGRSSVK